LVQIALLILAQVPAMARVRVSVQTFVPAQGRVLGAERSCFVRHSG